MATSKKDILELKRRVKKTEHNFNKVCGVYVDANREKVLNFTQNFLDLEEDEVYKYLEIAGKVLSGTVGNNILQLKFTDAEKETGGKQQFLMGLRASELNSPELLDTLYDMIIDQYGYVGNFLVLMFYGAYDIMTKTSDELQLDESEETYKYLLCAVCPVVLSKAGLGYRSDENRIGARIRDWVVSSPENGFVFPAFDERSADIDSVIFYAKNPKEPHSEMMSEILGCAERRTSTQKKERIKAVVKNLKPTEDEGEMLYEDLQSGIESFLAERENMGEEDPVEVTHDAIIRLSQHMDIPDEVCEKIAVKIEEDLGDDDTQLDMLFDKKAVTASQTRHATKKLINEVDELKEQIQEKDRQIESFTGNGIDVVVKVAGDKETKVVTQVIDGQRFLCVPVDDSDVISVNGHRV